MAPERNTLQKAPVYETVCAMHNHPTAQEIYEELHRAHPSVSRATMGKFDLAKRAKEQNLDAIHDTVHEMARDEAHNGRAFEGLLARYFK